MNDNFQKEAEELYPDPKREAFDFSDAVGYMYAKYETWGKRQGYIAAAKKKEEEKVQLADNFHIMIDAQREKIKQLEADRDWYKTRYYRIMDESENESSF